MHIRTYLNTEVSQNKTLRADFYVSGCSLSKVRLFPEKPGAQQPLPKSAVHSTLWKCDHLGGSKVPTMGSPPAAYLTAFHLKLKQLRFLWPVMYAELSSLCYRSPGLDRVFSLIFQLESKSLVSQALSFLLSSPDPSSNQVCAQHNQFNVGTDCSDSRACPCFAFCLLASSRLPISCSCLWFSCLCDRTDGIFSFLLPPI